MASLLQLYSHPLRLLCTASISTEEIELPIDLGLESKWRNLIPRHEANSLGFSLIGR